MAGAGQRLIGRGPILIGEDPTPLIDWADYTVDFDMALGAPRSAIAPNVPSLHAHTGWTMRVNFELPVIGRRLTPGLSIGSYNGVAFQQHSLKLEIDVKEGSGGGDDWKRWAVDVYKWTVEASKWEATDSYEVFLELLRTQSGTPYAALAYESYYGSGDVIIASGNLPRGSEVSQESLSLEGAGELSSSNALILAALAQVDGALENGYATAIPLSIPEGQGSAFFTAIEYTVPAGDKATGSVEWRGDGEFEVAGS